MPVLYPVILSGGSGTRLWPLSRSLYPKQLQALTSDRSMIQETALRLSGSDTAGPVVVCNNDHRFAIADQLQHVGVTPEAVILEPAGRNTAPAVAAAAILIAERAPDAILAILPADHAILDLPGFRAKMAVAVKLASAGKLVTFGIKPDKPHTGYGYIESGEAIGDGAHKVARFKEKPDAATAAGYLASGRYHWNSGIFVFQAKTYLAELERLQPKILGACREAVGKARRDLDFTRLDEAAFAASPSISIDYAVMEHTAEAAVIPVDIGWSDVGAWNALWEIGEKNPDGNVLLGDVIARDTRDSYVRTERTLVATLGVSNLLVVETGDAVLVAARDRAEEVKEIVADLKRNGRSEEESHRRHHRPWGFYEGLDDGDNYQVKHLMVKPGGRLSLQMHHHRAEHWVVVSGTGRITRGSETMILGPNESTYIPIGMQHRLENPGKLPLHLIEVQSGSYLGEDDIVRIEDVYQRAANETK
jgi:mannose-1-phosphate guanylyltransferase/mannose-6-phosphate isomerase